MQAAALTRARATGPVRPPAAAAPPPAASQPDPFPAIEGVNRYVHDMRTAEEEKDLHGIVYEQYADGTLKILKRPGETTPDVPAGGPDIPADAVNADHRVVIFVDGIHQTMSTQVDQIHRLLQAPRANPNHGASVDQPVIAIHEGVGKDMFHDVFRVGMDFVENKALEGRFVPERWLHRAIMRTDPVVRSVHDEIRQSLEAGRDVQLVAHSGGGAETAIALTMLSREDHGRFRGLIRDHVRLLELAPAAARKDYELAGVRRANIYYTGSRHDPLYHWAHIFLHPLMPLLNLPSLAAGVQSLIMLTVPGSLPYHAPDYIFWQNVQPDGTSRIQQFLDGKRAGEEYPVP